MTYFRISILLLLFVLASQTLPAQELDNALWTSLDVRKKLGHGLALNFEEEYRLKDNFTTTDKFQTTFDLSWKAFSFLKVGAAYCRIDAYKPSGQRYELRHRGYAYLAGDWKLGRFGFTWKERYQRTYKVGGDVSADDANPVDVIRSKFTADYNIKGMKINPYASCEVFYALNEPDGVQNPPSTKMVTEIRYAAGLSWSIRKNLELEGGYLLSSGRGWDDNYNGAGGYKPALTGAITVGLNYNF